MTRKENNTNRMVRKGVFVETDKEIKRLRKMSAVEIQAFYDRVEPVPDEEVREMFDRIMPRISYETSSEKQKKQSRSARGNVAKAALIALSMVLMLSVVAQAMGIPVWETFVIWAKDSMDIHIYRTNTPENAYEEAETDYADPETFVWGDDVYKVFEEIGVFPDLPTYIPEGFELYDMYYITGEDGYVHIDIQFKSKEDRYLNFVIDLFGNDDFIYQTGVEYDVQHSKEITINHITYLFIVNLSNNSVAWNDRYGSYYMSGDIKSDILEDMIRSIRREETEAVK